MSRLVADGGAALLAAVNDDETALRVGKSLYRAKKSAAIVGSVAGIYINVKRAQTKGAMIARGIAERQNLSSAILTDKARIVF